MDKSELCLTHTKMLFIMVLTITICSCMANGSQMSMLDNISSVSHRPDHAISTSFHS